MAELKPCPFCGGSVRFDKAYSYFRDSVIYCDDCDMVFTLDDCQASDDEICEAWNRRADNGFDMKVEIPDWKKAKYIADMSAIADYSDKDKELAHINADGLLLEILKEIGLSEVAEEFDRFEKWYS